MKHILCTIGFFIVCFTVIGQKYFTRTAHIDFYSHTPIEDIKADNHSSSLVLDASTGQIEVSCAIKAFEFEKALMQEHFNENYMESGKYPNAIFKGKIEDIASVAFTKDGTYTVNATGKLTCTELKTPSRFLSQLW